MHTSNHRPVRVYLHPAAATNITAIRAIEAVTGRIACIHPADNRVRLVTHFEYLLPHARHIEYGGAAC